MRAPPSRWRRTHSKRGCRCANRLGLHARPAGRIVSAVGGLDAQVTVERRAARSADARSLTAIAVLAVRQGAEVVAHASGADAQRALDALAALAAGNFGDDDAAERRRRADGRARPCGHAGR